ncbi:hypothetical protein M1K46_11945 [Fictibacillus sp. WQ 8-8]|nr:MULTISPECIES: hypothetical protein [unclassified Fictibacillus]MCQ6266367.1 hypothetical protein [Fictibacillus sp. WQ 8-8]MED2972412.1 hypothetical protein [Fictibacillus sp. B-59209]UZJ80493.1 hypothetical protein OKX00_08580 [Fictibacillus sp. KU28468]SFD63585.1 hypothetical protein SAMN05428981_1011207 [Bacillus sp. OV194]
MFTLQLFFGTITVSFKRKIRTHQEVVHQQEVNERFEASRDKVVNTVLTF